VDPQLNPLVSLDFPEPVDNPPSPVVTHLVFHKSIDPHPIIYKETSVQTPTPTKNLTCQQRRSRRSMTSVTKLHFDFFHAFFVLVFFTFLHCFDIVVEPSMSSLE
jgi:hypothetical protein